MAAPISPLEYVRVDPYAVISDTQPQLVRFVVHFCFNLARAGMMKGVIQGFFADLREFVAHDRMKCARLSIHNNVEFAGMNLLKLTSRIRECARQVCVAPSGASEIQQKLTALLHYVVGLPKHVFENIAGGLILRQLGSRSVES